MAETFAHAVPGGEHASAAHHPELSFFGKRRTIAGRHQFGVLPGLRRLGHLWRGERTDRCRFYGVPFFFKQWGGVNKKGGR
jgi:hypothetical protein